MKIRHILLATCCFFSMHSFASEWQPVAAESLVELPANLIEKRIEQDFRLSPVAQRISDIEVDLVAKSNEIQAIQSLLEGSTDDQMMDEKVTLVKLKSAFLDDMQEGQFLRQQALDTKVELYQEVLEQLYQLNQKNTNSLTFEIKQQQQKAKERMQNVMYQVDQSFTQQGFAESTPYADEFSKNLAKIQKLKEAINAHESNISPMVDGIAVSSQDYVRQLLMQAASEQSLLDQEGLMISYMSRLVALDAQALEYALNVQAAEEEPGILNSSTTPAKAVDLFL